MARSVGPVPDSKEHRAHTNSLSAWHCALHPHCQVKWALCALRELHAEYGSPHSSVQHMQHRLPRQVLLLSDTLLLCVQVLGPTSDEDTMLLQAADEQNAAAGLGPGSEGGSKGQGEG